MRLNLSYVAELDNGYPIRYLQDNLRKVFDVYAVGSDIAPEETEPEVQASRLSGTPLYNIHVKASVGRTGLDLSQLLAMTVGHPFRSSGVQTALLTRLDLDGDDLEEDDLFPGPLLGFESIQSLDDWATPEFMISFPPFRDRSEYRKLMSWCADEGVSAFCDDAPAISSQSRVTHILSDLESLSCEHGRDLRYYFGGHLSTPLRNGIEQSLSMDARERYFGWRMCPIAAGLDSISEARTDGLSVLSYGLLSLSRGDRAIAQEVLARFLRWAGVDIMVIGSNAREAVEEGATESVLDVLTDEGSGQVEAAVPAFSGSITPRLAHELVTRFGSRQLLHMQSPVLRGREREQDVRRNVRAIQEAARIAVAQEDPEAAIGREAKDTKHWRSYEDDYGVDYTIDQGLRVPR